MKGIISFSVKRPVTIFMLFLAIIIFSLIAASGIKIGYLPDITVPRLVISTVQKGLPPEEVRELITIPVEEALSSMNGLKKISSISRQDISSVELEFQWGTNMITAAVEAREIIDTTCSNLPQEAKKPLVVPLNPGEMPVLVIGVLPINNNLALAGRLAEKEIKTRIQQIAGVGSVTIVGVRKEEVSVLLDQSKTVSRNADPGTVAQMLAESNFNYPAGSFKEGSVEYIVKTEGRIDKIESLGNLFLQNTVNKEKFRLKDIAEIKMGEKEISSIFQVQGSEAVALIVRKKHGESPVKMAEKVIDELSRIKKTYQKDLKIEVLKNSSILISDSIKDLVISACIGAFIAFIIIFLFIKKIKTALILILSIPISILTALLLLRISGRTLNIISLGGLALGIGMLVDNSVVVLDNLQKKVKASSKNIKDAVIIYTAETAGSTFGSTCTTLIVFLPIIFMPGLIGSLFTDLALSVTFSLIASFFVSITLIPVLFITVPAEETGKEKKRSAVFEKYYRKTLRVLIRKPVLLPVLLITLIIPGVAGIFYLQFEFMPDISTQEINIEILFPPGTSLEWISKSASCITEQLLSVKETANIYARAGGEDNDIYFLSDTRNSRRILHITVMLDKNTTQSADSMKNLLQTILYIDQGEIRVLPPENIITPLLNIRSGETALTVQGETQEEAKYRAEDVKNNMLNRGFLSSVSVIPSGEKPQIQINPDRTALAKHGISLLTVSEAVYSAVYGIYPAKIEIAGEDIDIRVKLRESDINTIDNIKQIRIQGYENTGYQLSGLADVSMEYSNPFLLRENRKDVFIIKGFSNNTKKKMTEKYISALTENHPYIRSKAGSLFKTHSTEIIMITGLSIILLYLILGAQFESFILPLLLMISLPLSFSGIVSALVISNNSVNFNSAMGVFVILGIAINNSIILFETYRQKIHSTENPLFSIYRGSSERLQPILITMFTTITAMLPLALNLSGKSAQSGMAAAIIGGLFISTILTLLILPPVFIYWYREKNGISK